MRTLCGLTMLPHRFLLIGGLLSVSWLMPLGVRAQIIPDGTLGGEASQVQALDAFTDLIDQGARRGSVLFHSFEQFSIEAGRGVYFANPSGIATILSRVTGDNRSNILGTLGVLGEANLFFLNPNGIVFGPGARLDVSGSFVASTGDHFTFSDGSIFSATDPNAPPLLTVNLTPGLQLGAGQAPVINQAQLTAGQDLGLHGSLLTIQGGLTAGQDLTLNGNRIEIRDTAAAPVIAEAGGALRLIGHDIDVFALNHPLSGLASGGDLVLRSQSPVVGDARFRSGGSFRVEALEGGLGPLTSPRDPVIRAAGDVALNSYSGASLHILAGGSVTIPGQITITGADPANGLVDAVVLSDGSTVQINGQTTPTLDVRAGTLAAAPAGASPGAPPVTPSATATGAEITLGRIQNPGGTVVLTNQHQPNLVLETVTITVGEIDTSTGSTAFGNGSGLTELQVQGGNVAVDSRGDIALTGKVNTSATAALGTVSTPAIGDGAGEATAGQVQLLADGNVTTQGINASARADLFIRDGQPNDGLASDGTASATGGDIRVRAREFATTGELVTTARANAEVDAIATISTTPNGISGLGGEIGTPTATATGGDITLETQSAIAASALNTAATALVDAKAFADTFEFSPADEVILTGGQIEAVRVAATGGSIILASQSSINTGSLTTGAEAIAFADTAADIATFGETSLIDVTGGTAQNVTVDAAGGNITIKAQSSITTGNQSTLTDVTALTFANGNVVTFANADTIRSTGGTAGAVTITASGGEVALTTQEALTVGNLNTVSRSFDIAVNAGADVSPFDDLDVAVVDAQGGEIEAVDLTLIGGDIILNAAGTTTTGELRTAAGINETDFRADASLVADGEAAIAESNLRGGTIRQTDVSVASGDITIASQGDINAGNLITGIDTELDGLVGVSLFNGETAGTVSLTGGTVESLAFTATGGDIRLGSQAAITTAAISTDVAADVAVSAGLPDLAEGQLGAVEVIAIAGDIDLAATANLTTSNLGSTADALVAKDETFLLGGNPDAGSAVGGDIALSSTSGLVAPLPGSAIRSNISNSNGDGGNIRLAGASIALDNSFLVTTVPGIGSTGNIALLADGAITVNNSRLFTVREASSTGPGAAGDIEIAGSAIALNDFSFLNTASFGQGDAGQVALQSTQGDIVLNDSSIFSLTAVEGNAAPVSLEAASAVRLNGNSVVNTTVALGATGQGGDVNIQAGEGFFITGVRSDPAPAIIGTDPTLPEQEPNNRRNSAQPIDNAFALASNADVLFSEDIPFVSVIGSNEDGSSDFYAVRVEAVGTQITFDVDAVTPTDSSQALDAELTLFDAQGNRLASNDNAPVNLGAGGSSSPSDAYLTYIFNQPSTYIVELALTPKRLDIDETGTYALNISRVDDFLVSSGITAQTRSTGSSGDIAISAPRIDLQRATISALSSPEATGNAGNVQVRTERLTAENSAITVSSPLGQAGNVGITAGVVLLDHSEISAETGANAASGEASANVVLDGLRLLVLRNGSVISAQANAGANGGNIRILAPEGFIVADGFSNSDIIASAERAGDGGRIDIVALSLFGLQERPGLFEALRTNDTNDISASSEFGVAGEIIINELAAVPVQDATELPTALTAPQLAQGCQGTASSSRFVDTGRGGLPAQPFDPASGDRLWEAIGFFQPSENSALPSPDTAARPTQVIEAQGWQRNALGQIVLVVGPTSGVSTCLDTGE